MKAQTPVAIFDLLLGGAEGCVQVQPLTTAWPGFRSRLLDVKRGNAKVVAEALKYTRSNKQSDSQDGQEGVTALTS